LDFRMQIMVLPGATEVHAIVSVAATGAAPAEPETALWIEPEPGATVRFVQQTRPSRGAIRPIDGAYRTGRWAVEEREFHVCLEMPALADGRKRVVAVVFLLRPEDHVLAEGTILAGRDDGFIAPPPPLPR
jgi:hypothetical protein